MPLISTGVGGVKTCVTFLTGNCSFRKNGLDEMKGKLALPKALSVV